jgi:hypothetical protein
MVDAEILKKFNCTADKIRSVFTCEDPSQPEYNHRKEFEKRICARINSGWLYSLQNSHLYAAADLAWDSAPITRENIPLMLYAQKKIKLERASSELENLGCASQFVRKDKDGNIKEIDLPRLYETSVNLVRSYLTRRLAPQASKYNNLLPFFRYEPRTVEQVGKLRGDALSQRVEIMSDQFNYRHLQTQAIRDVLLYGRCVLFPSCAWDRETQWQFKEIDPNLPTPEDTPVEAVVVREGVDFVRPHPSRVMWDSSFPLSSLNNAVGTPYVGFWDLRKYRDLLDNGSYFNRNKIRVSTTGKDFYSQYRLYFDTQFNAQRIKFTSLAELRATDPATGNDIVATSPFYQATEADETMFVTEYYERVTPNQCGLGDYPFPVWLRLVIASDDTVVYGEFLPTSAPAIYFGFNENDNRASNISMAHEIMPFQDQISNLLSQLLLTAKNGAMKIVTMDTDMVTKEIRDGIKSTMEGDKYYVTPMLLEYSGNTARNMGQNTVSPISVIETKMQDDITSYFQSISSLLSIVERMLILSPQELGQAAPRVISATESNEISNSVSTVYTFISDSIDEGRSAWKRFVYEALVNKATERIEVPVTDRYPENIVKAAGLDVKETHGSALISQQLITGSKKKLIHDYVFTSRDGSDRPINSQSANTLVQLLSQVVNVPGVLEAMGKKKLYALINEIFRLSGAGFETNLEVKDGEEDSFGPPVEDLQSAIKQLAQEVQAQGQGLQDTQGQLKQIVDLITQAQQSAQTMPTSVGESAPGVPGTPPIGGAF